MVELIPNPGENWLTRLRTGNKVWLVKEQKTAEVVFAYEPSPQGYKTGRIGIRHGSLDAWFVDTNGRGIDGSLLMQPIVGHLADNPQPLAEPIIRQLQRTVENLQQRVAKLERQPHSIFSFHDPLDE